LDIESTGGYMATTTPKKYAKRKRGYQGNTRKKKSNFASMMLVGVGVLVLGLIAFGMVQVLGLGSEQSTNTTALQVDSNTLHSTSLEEGAGQQNVAEAPVAATDPETRYLGPASDPAGLALAEQGELESPTLVWFHADW
jgi:septal ring-binding cell division protein DamX